MAYLLVICGLWVGPPEIVLWAHVAGPWHGFDDIQIACAIANYPSPAYHD